MVAVSFASERLVASRPPHPPDTATDGLAWVSLAVPLVDRPAQRAVVVLACEEDGWAVVFPRVSAEEVRVSDLALTDGDRRVDVPRSAFGDLFRAGTEARVAVACPEAGDVRWELPEEVRWDDVRQALAHGRVPLLEGQLPEPS